MRKHAGLVNIVFYSKYMGALRCLLTWFWYTKMVCDNGWLNSEMLSSFLEVIWSCV